MSTRNIGGGLGGEQIVFPLLVPAPSLTPPLAAPEDDITPPPEEPEEDITWAQEATKSEVDDVVINDEYLCSEVTTATTTDEQSSLELVMAEETSIDNDLLNLLADDDVNVFDEDKWDQMMNEPNPSSTDDALSSVGSLGDTGSLGDELLPPWDPDDGLLQPPMSKKPSYVDPMIIQQPSPSTVTMQMHTASAYPSAPPPTMEQQQGREALPSNNDIMVKLTVPGQPNLSVTLERDKLLSMPADRFNHLLDRSGLSENDVAYMKEWRRKGKNKMAAQQARKRKREEVDEMAAEVNKLKEELAMLREERQSLQVELEHYPRECQRLEHMILTNYHDQHDDNVTPDTHRIVLLSDTLLVAPVVQ